MEGRRFKLANLGGEPEESFEQAFASLAFTYLKDKAPRLLDYMAGFQLVERNDDNTKAVGVFGFRIGNTWVYAPVFFLNADLKGHELLYVKNQDLFVPLKESWVNYLLAKKPHILGEQTGENTQQLGVLQPDIRNLSIPPIYSKYGSDTPPWFREFLPDLGRLATVSPREKTAHITLPELAAESLCFARMAKKACDTWPVIAHYCEQFYGRDWLKTALEKIKSKAQKQIDSEKPSIFDSMENEDAEERLERRNEVLNKDGSFILTGQAKVAAADTQDVDIRVLPDIGITHNDPDLTDDQKERLLRDGYLVKDYRKGDEVSKAYSIQLSSNNELSNPEQSGVYELLTRPGKFEEVLIIANPYTGRGMCDFCTVIKMSGGDSKAWTNCHRSTLWTRPLKEGKEEQRAWYDEQSGTEGDSLTKGATYIALAPGRMGGINGSTPFVVDEVLGEGRYRVHWNDYADRSRPKYLRHHDGRDESYSRSPFFDTTAGNWGRDEDFYSGSNMLYVSDREGTSFKIAGGGLMVPSPHKLIKIKDAYKPPENDDSPCCAPIECWHSNPEAIEPGDWSDLQLQIMQKMAQMKVYVQGNECQLNNGPMVPMKTALFELIKDYGLREKQAKHILKEAERSSIRRERFECRIKYARGYPSLQPGPSAPAIPEPQYGSDGAFGAVNTQMPMEQFQAVPELSSGLTDPTTYDPRPEYMPDPMAMQSAQQAGQAGQKEVFDTTMIAGLLKSVRKDSLVDRYTGDLMKAMDRLGRILFLFYWHNDDFTDKYGKADMPELEDTVRNAFDVLGDLLLFLKSKDVEPLPGTEMGDADVDDVTGD
jgi:hypothetical protein